MATTKIIVASGNPVKVAAIDGAFAALFPGQAYELDGVPVASGVADQPMSSAETRRGAEIRATAAQLARSDADIWVGVEGGIEDRGGPCGYPNMQAFAWICVRTPGRQSACQTATFPLPPAVAQLVRQGVELGEADDRVFGRSNSKQSEGAIGLLTDSVIDRQALYQHAAIMALIPLKQTKLFAAHA